MRDDWTSPLVGIGMQDLFAQALPGISVEEMETNNLIAGADFLNEAALNGQTIGFRIAPVLDKVDCKPFLITADVNGKKLCIGCDVDAFSALFPDTFEPDTCDVAMLRFLLHLLSQTVGGPVAGLCGDSLKLDLSEVTVLPPPVTAQIELILDGQPGPSVLVWGALDLLTPFAKTAPTVSADRFSSSLKFSCRLSSRVFRGLPIDQHGLEVGGLIYMENTHLEKMFDLVAGQNVLAPVTFRGGAVVIAPNSASIKTETTHGDISAVPKDETIPDPDDLQTELSFEVGDWKMSLAEVKDIQPGSILNVDQLDLNFVKIRLNGELVGTGSLMSVADGIAVRIKTVI